MGKAAFKGVYFLHGLALGLAAIGSFHVWGRRFWLQKHVHVMAGVGFVIAPGLFTLVPADAPVNRYGILSRCLF